MSQHYSEFSVYPYIPKKFTTEQEVDWLNKMGIIGCHDAADDSYHFYVVDADNYHEDLEEWMFDEDEEEKHKEILEKLAAGECITFAKLFQNMILRSEGELQQIKIQGAYYGGKSRWGDLGGFVYQITKDQVLYSDTATLLAHLRDPQSPLAY